MYVLGKKMIVKKYPHVLFTYISIEIVVLGREVVLLVRLHPIDMRTYRHTWDKYNDGCYHYKNSNFNDENDL